MLSKHKKQGALLDQEVVSTLVSTVELKTEPEKEWEDIEAEKNEIKFQNREANV